MQTLSESAQQFLKKEWENIEIERQPFSEWRLDPVGDLTKRVYDGISQKKSLEFITKFDIEQVLKQSYFRKLIMLMDQRADYHVWNVFYNFNSMLPYSIPEVEENINSLFNELNFKHECVYQKFTFQWEIRDYYYIGDILVNKKEITEADVLEVVKSNSEENNFFPKLIKDINEVIGDDNFIFDYFELENNCFHLFWYIHQSVYSKKMTDLKGFFFAMDIDHLVSFEEQKVGNLNKNN